jgi:hypothetical protein
MTWKESAAQLGTSTLVAGLEALKGTMKKKDFKRLVATTAAQVLAVTPGIKPRKARRWVRKATGARPAKSVGGPKKRQGALRTAAEAAGAAVLTAGAAKVAESPAVKRRVRGIRRKVESAVPASDEDRDQSQ